MLTSSTLTLRTLTPSTLTPRGGMIIMKEYQFVYNDKVRDYECDIQGVVNNSVYQNYLEHARHEYLLALGVSFSDLANQGIHLVVIRSQLDYKKSLKPGDKYSIGINLIQASKVRFEFCQDIYVQGEQSAALTGRVMGVALNQRGRPCVLPVMRDIFEKIKHKDV